jgi:glycosyltransferase involved in cell wall biosynthesis
MAPIIGRELLKVQDPPQVSPRPSLKRIAFFLHALEAGGAQKRTAQLASGIAALGVPVDLLLVNGGGPNRAELSPAVSVFEVGALWRSWPWFRERRKRRVFSAVPGLVRYLRSRRPDVWVAAANHTHFAALAAHRLAHVQSSALVLRVSNALVDGRDDRRQRRLQRARMFYPRADALITVAPGLRDELVREIPDLAARTSVVVNPVIDAGIHERAAAKLCLDWDLRGAALVVGIGRLVPQKDFATLLRAFAAIEIERDVRLLLLGEGPERARLERLASELGVRDRVLMPGFVENPFPALKRADVVVSASRWEGLPGVLVEALALGRPVVATDITGARAVLGERSPHPLVPIGDARAMAAAIRAQLLAPAAPEIGLRRVGAFTVEAGSQALLAVLERVHERRLAQLEGRALDTVA